MAHRRGMSDLLRRSLVLLLGLMLPLAAFSSVTLVQPSSAFAQEADDLEEIADEAPPAEAPVAEEGGAAAPGADAPAVRKSRLAWLIESLGIGYSLVFLGLSFTLVALIVMNILSARRDSIAPQHLVDTFEAQLKEKKYQEAYETAKNDDSFLGHVLAAGLTKLSSGYPQAVEAMQEVGEDEGMKLEHRLSYVALVGTISPMVGLLGTVHGMINAFIVIATSPGQPKPSELAAGISTALITTALGLLLAIPAIGFYGIMRNWMSRLVLEVGIVSEGLMSRFQKKSAN